MQLQIANLFACAEAPGNGERFETLLKHKNLMIERIVSSSSISLQEYVQPQDEWVVLIQGTATLQVVGKRVELQAGDYLFLSAGTPHTVERVSPGALWLAVHLYPEPAA